MVLAAVVNNIKKNTCYQKHVELSWANWKHAIETWRKLMNLWDPWDEICQGTWRSVKYEFKVCENVYVTSPIDSTEQSIV